MSNPFGNLTASSEMEETTDRLGGGNFVFESGLYTGTIELMYAHKSESGANGITFHVKMPDGTVLKQTEWVTNRKGENFYLSSQSGKNAPLPGFTVINDICLCTVGQELREMKFEEKQVNQWDKEAKAEVPKAALVAMAVIGKTITLGVLKVKKNKTKKNDQGAYVDINEAREENTIDKVFHTKTRRTVVEARKQQEAAFIDGWEKKNTGVTRDLFKEVQGGPQSGHSAPPPAGGGIPPQAGSSNGMSLFD
ncbi:ssDNA binding protein [Alcaligenes phage vB_Af_QDWS595]|uniref:SsDNA binding protein n=1 Tax=Alcaligenes phage vB_Af_QDWS595 TaxID=2877946 RepID=A0AAE8Y1L5_9CAUD|nr:ssDNA binding protein [Alcaligenes phage vB_Af_QDWS595]UCR75512.1 ssDNA binding protein [Alcaligenes phage vB_Af_QDWS595]